MPSAAQLDSIPLVRKQDFGPRLLRTPLERAPPLNTAKWRVGARDTPRLVSPVQWARPPPIADGRGGDAAIIAAGAALSATAAAITAAGSAAEHAWLEALRPRADGRRADRRRRLRAPPARVGALRDAAGPHRRRRGSSPRSRSPRTRGCTRSGGSRGWLCEPLLIYLVLAFPTGRLRTPRRPRCSSARVAPSPLVLYLPIAPCSSSSSPSRRRGAAAARAAPTTRSWSSPASRPSSTTCCGRCARCSPCCSSRPSCVRLALRLARATRLMRRVLAPVLVVAIARFAVFAALIVHARGRPGLRGADDGRVGARAQLPADGAGVPGRHRALAPVHRRRPPAPGRPSGRPPRARGAAVGAGGDVRRPVAADRLPERRTASGRRRRAGRCTRRPPGRTAG